MQTVYVIARKVEGSHTENIEYLEHYSANGCELYFCSQLRHATFFETFEEPNDLRGDDPDLIIYKVEIKIISSPM